MSWVRFNRNEVVVGRSIEPPTEDVLRNTLGLWCASPEDAIRYGGEATRAAIGAMDLRGDRKYIVVDTKVHMLMPGMLPAIPGWHTDGAPRKEGGCPVGPLPPDVRAQEDMRPPRFHLLVTGSGCLTEFWRHPNQCIDIPDRPTSDLYRAVTEQVDALAAGDPDGVWEAPSCTVVEWDWWNLHRGRPATVREWRFLIRVVETDYLAPCRDLRQVIRTQQQVYVPMEFGW